VTIDLTSTDRNSIPVTTEYSDGRRSLGGIWPSDQWTRFIDEYTARSGAARSAVEGRFLVAAALMDRVDGLVVGDLDFGTAATFAARANPMTPETACALVGLAARLRTDFSIAPVPRSLFHFLVARGLLVEGWRWFAACAASSHATNDDTMINVGQSGLERMARAVVSRDRCIGHDFNGKGDMAAEDAAYYFDVELLMLSSALDSVARVAHVAHVVKGETYSVGWRREKGWRKALKKAAPKLWAETEPGTLARDAIELVAVLRNTIHGEGMRKITVGTESSLDNQLEIAQSDATALDAILSRHGGSGEWGLTPGSHARLQPAPYAQQIVPLVAQAMNSLMRLTEVERLPGVDSAALMTGPPVADELFRSDLTERLLLLTGLA